MAPAGGWDGGKNATRRKQYAKIFHDDPSIVRQVDPDRAYWPSSLSSGQRSMTRTARTAAMATTGMSGTAGCRSHPIARSIIGL